MPHKINHSLLRCVVMLLIAALVWPAMSPPALAHAAVVGSRAGAPETGERSRLHSDGWLDFVPPAERAGFEQDLITRLSDWTARHITPRPPVDPVLQQQRTAQWTVMIYMAADNNLEAAGLFDINEMEAVGSTQDVNILVQIDRSSDYVDIDGDWSDTRRFYIQQDQDIETITTSPLEILGETNSGDANVVADFAIWGITNFPAQKYMFVMWDHGGGWYTHVADEDSGDDISLPELTGALDRVISETGIDKFEVFGFDMCLMGQLEVFETVAPYARYSVGSQESEPGPGWFYVYLEQLVNNPAMGGAELVGYVIDYFMTFFEEIMSQAPDLYGLSAVDLSQGATVAAAVDGLVSAVEANPQAVLSALADARNNTISYGGYDDPQYYDVWSSVDLYQFNELLTQITTMPEVQQAAQGVMQAVGDFVIHERHNDQLEGSHGVAIYFPRTIKAYDLADFHVRYGSDVPPSLAKWANFLDIYTGTATSVVTTAPSVSILSVYPDVVSIYQPAVIALEVSGRDVLEVNYAVALIQSENERVVLDYDYLVSRTTTASGADIIDWSDGVSNRTFLWDAEVPMITDGSASTYALLLPTRDNPDIAIVNGEYTSVRGGDPLQAQMIFDLNTRTATSLWGLNESASGALQPFELQPEDGDHFRPLWLTLDANNDLAGTSFGDMLTLTASLNVAFQMVPAPSGQYAISLAAENVAGETNLTEAIVQVNNDGLDAKLRGYTDLAYGVNFLYPASWVRPRFTPDGQRLFTADVATNTIMSLFPYTGVASAEETNAAVQAGWSNLTDLQIVNERQLEIGGLPAYVTDYTYTFNGQGRVGAVIAIYVPDQAVGYGFDLDAPAENPAPAQEALNALVNSINFFQSQQVVGPSAWQAVSAANGTVSFPVPSSWVQETVDNWVLYGPADNLDVFIGLAYAPASGQNNEALAQYWVAELQGSVNNLEILAAEPYFVGNQEWFLVVFTYDGTVKMAGAFFATSVGGTDYTFWLEAPDAQFDQMYTDTFSVSVDGFEFTQ